MESKKLTNTTRKTNNNSKMKKLTLKNVGEKIRMKALKDLSEDPIPFLEKKSIDDIAKLMKLASFKYYEGEPVITDDIFDIMKNYVAAKDPKHPVLEEIGAVAPGKKVSLPYWMGSLDKIREDEKALTSWKSKYDGDVVISDKLDGNSAMLVYSPKGIKMYSRGDGLQGQDISNLVPLIQGVPKISVKDTFAVRGELIISKENWLTKGKGANARNAVAGVMHSKVPDPELVKVVEFVAYEQLHPRVKISDSLNELKTKGFHVVHNVYKPTGELTMENLSTILMDRRKVSSYDIDGIVIFHDGDHNQVSGKNPSYAFAFKSLLTHEEAEVIIKQVEWNPSKDGYLKPLLYFDPVVLAGASIQKATGFNGKYIEENVIGPGSRIVIIRSGDVIPHVVRILSKSATNKPSFPDESIGWDWNDSHVDIVLKDKTKDADVNIKQMEHFASVLEMKGVGKGVITKLYKNNIDSVKKLLNVTEEQLVSIEGFQKKSAQKIVSEIKDSLEKADCLTFMVASNLFGRSIGDKKLKVIVEAFPKVYEGIKPSESELSAVKTIGSVTASQFLKGLDEFFSFMKDLGIPCKTKEPVQETVNQTKPSLEHLVVVFTGFRNKELESEIESRGGKIGSVINKKTKVLVAKDPSENSGKITLAKELNIPVVDESTFIKDYI